MTDVEPWTACPRCGVERFHLFGRRRLVATGRRVSMAVPPPFPTASRYSPDELPVDVPGFREVPAAELVEEIARECRGCGATWQERTGHRSARPFPSSSPCEPSCVLSLADEVCGRCGTEREPGSLARDLDRPMLWWAAGGAVHLRGRP